jgi:hypothetical protein
MIGFVALPLVIAIAAALLSGRALDRLAPAPAARWNTVLLVAVVVAAVPTFWILALSGLTHFGVRNSLCDWSAHLLPAHPVAGAAIGGTALLVSVVGAIRVVRVLITHFRIRCTERRRFELIETAEVFAYTLDLRVRSPSRAVFDRRWTTASSTSSWHTSKRTHAIATTDICCSVSSCLRPYHS